VNRIAQCTRSQRNVRSCTRDAVHRSRIGGHESGGRRDIACSDLLGGPKYQEVLALHPLGHICSARTAYYVSFPASTIISNPLRSPTARWYGARV
jgi:hypothetical protein